MKATKKSPSLTAAFADHKLLRSGVKPGLGALEKTDKDCIDHPFKQDFVKSIALDKVLETKYPNDKRWDYLLETATLIIAVEIHDANSSQVQVVIDKKKAARTQLQAEVKTHQFITKWVWVSSGKVALQPLDRAIRLLAQNGITFAGRTLQSKHLA